MKHLITGIDGFVGGHLAVALVASGRGEVSGLVLNREAAVSGGRIPTAARLYEADISDARGVLDVVDRVRPDRVYHIAGQAYVPHAMKDPYATFQVNIMGGIHVLEAVRKVVPTCHVLIVSSGEVYGFVAADRLPIDESFPIDPKNPYAASKGAIDLVAQQYRRSFGMNVVITRSFNHLGPGQSDIFAGSSFARQIVEVKLGIREGRIDVGSLDNRRDMTDVRDVVRAYVSLAEKMHDHDVFNVCSGKAVSMREILAGLIRISGVRVDIVPDPARIRSSDNPIMIGNPGRLVKATGWSPTIPLEQTLADILAYWETRLKS